MLSQNIKYILILLLIACAHQDKKLVNESEALKACHNEIPVGCYFYAVIQQEAGKTEEAKSFFAKACEKSHQPSCTNLGILKYQSKEIDESLKISKESCRSGDALGCYNSACFLCQNQDKKNALIYLNKSINLGFADNKWAEQDTDLTCFKDDPLFTSWLTKVEKIAQTQKRISPYHLSIPHWGISFIPPQNMKSQLTHPIEFYDEKNQTRFSIGVSSISSQELKNLIIVNVSQLQKNFPQFETIESSEKTVNDRPYYYHHFKYFMEGRWWNYLQVVTGNEHHSAYAWSFYPEETKTETKDQLKYIMNHIVIHPEFSYNSTSQKDLAELKGFKYQGVSIQNETLFSQKGRPIDLDATTPYYSFSVNTWNPDEKFSMKYARKLFTQLIPAYYVHSLVLAKETIKIKDVTVVHIKSSLAYPVEIPKTLQMSFYLAQKKDKIINLKYFHLPKDQPDQNAIYKLLEKKLK